jgi:hypothetical protein
MAIEEFWFVPATYNRSEYVDAPSPVSGSSADPFLRRTAVVACLLLERFFSAKRPSGAFHQPVATRAIPAGFSSRPTKTRSRFERSPMIFFTG